MIPKISLVFRAWRATCLRMLRSNTSKIASVMGALWFIAWYGVGCVYLLRWVRKFHALVHFSVRWSVITRLISPSRTKTTREKWKNILLISRPEDSKVWISEFQFNFQGPVSFKGADRIGISAFYQMHGKYDRVLFRNLMSALRHDHPPIVYHANKFKWRENYTSHQKPTVFNRSFILQDKLNFSVFIFRINDSVDRKKIP